MKKNSTKTSSKYRDCELILGNSNKRFSGVTSTMLQNFAFQKSIMPTLIMGKHHVENKHDTTSFWALVFCCRGYVNGKWRIFHARRNNEVVQAFILKYIFRLKIKVVFTSTAQRDHSKFTRWLIKHCDGLLSTCNAAAAYLKRQPDAIIAHGIRTDIYQPVTSTQRQKTKQKYDIKSPSVCGIFGRVREQKGVHLFVDACIKNFEKNDSATAIIVGAIKPEDQNFVGNLKKKISDKNLENRIRFLGEQPFSALPELFSITDVVCALSREEGFGLTVLEAMSSGAAVIATHAGAWPEIVRQDVDGKLVDFNDIATVYSALDSLINNPDLLAKMGENCIKRVHENYQTQSESLALCHYFKNLQQQ